MKKTELLAPAGNFEKLEIAVNYGADAVYLAGKDFSLRNSSGNFSPEELEAAVAYARKNGVKMYLACNIYSRNNELSALRHFLEFMGDLHPDALIIADPGILRIAAEIVPGVPVHLSTQANTTNYSAARFWADQGIKRINAARELSLEEISEIVSRTDMEVEVFVHGAMCVSYSGRCLLSSYMANRESNRGMCAHPCRWKYAVVEETRPGRYMPLMEDDRGTYIFNSSDLCMIEHIPELIESGVSSLKIEGRMKGIHYLASVVSAYRTAIDAYYENPDSFEPPPDAVRSLEAVNNRGYCTGFYFGNPAPARYKGDRRADLPLFAARAIGMAGPGRIRVEIRNKVLRDDLVEIMRRDAPTIRTRIRGILDVDGSPVPFARPGSTVTFLLDAECRSNDLFRKIEPIPSDTENRRDRAATQKRTVKN